MKQAAKNLVLKTAQKILSGFEGHYRAFRKAAIDAKTYFEKDKWNEDDSQNRIYFYDSRVNRCCDELAKSTNIKLFDEVLWIKTKLIYTQLITDHNQSELAETFYNSVFCRLFDKRFYHNEFIFVKPAISTDFVDMDKPIINSYYVQQTQLEQSLAELLKDFDFKKYYEDFNRDVSRLAQQFVRHIHVCDDEYFGIEMINTPFFRRGTAYLIGRATSQNNTTYPLLIALTNPNNKGLVVDTLLSNVDDISIVFSFSRSYFFVDIDYPAAAVDFLKSIMPNKTRAALYSSIGLHKQGKTLLYRDFLQYSKITNEKLTIAPGIKGMVMTVFTFPMFPYVFKVINDHFAPPKTMTKKNVKDKYFFVKNHRRIGRMADTWEFSNVAFPIVDLDTVLLESLKDKTPSNIEIDGQLLIVKHLYMENKMIPLNIYLNHANNEQADYIINDYGKAIDELINAGIFPGDMLTKNFGVTRQNRVVFYDYDEVVPMEQPVFRKIPPPRHAEDELAREPWYYVGTNDVFPEEFRYFMFTDERKRKAFNQNYKKLLEVEYWQAVQNKIKANKIANHYPYEQKYRMCEIYKPQ